MDIPNSTDSTATEFQSREGKTANQHTVIWEQIDLPRSRESVRLKSRPGREFRAYRPFHPQGKLRNNTKVGIVALFDSRSRQFIPSKIIIASTERPRRTSPGAPFPFSLVPPTASHQFPTARPAQTNAILVRREAASIRPPTTCCGSWRPREEPIGSRARPDSTARCCRAVTYGIDSGGRGEVGFGKSHRDGGNRTLSDELAAIRR
jgi:hypothetical protein